MGFIKDAILREIKEHKLMVFGLVLMCMFFLVVAVLGFSLSYMRTKANTPLAGECHDQEFVVGEGEGAKRVAQNLERAGLVSDDLYFMYYVGIAGSSKKLQAGKYVLASCMSVKEIADLITRGRTANEVAVTFPEGLSLRDIEEKCQLSVVGCQLSSFRTEDFKDEYEFLRDAPPTANLEGYLFPDTYFFDKDSSEENTVRKMLDNFGRKLSPDLHRARSSRGKTVYEIVTVASLIEKEVRSLEDRKVVSGIIWKRLEFGMPLQIDATIMYIIGTTDPEPEASPRYGASNQQQTAEKITYEDLEVDSPYNTYRNRGLPPGPIASPGLESIVAAIYPRESEYLYYLSRPDGETVFSRTLEEHNRAKAKYLSQ